MGVGRWHVIAPRAHAGLSRTTTNCRPMEPAVYLILSALTSVTPDGPLSIEANAGGTVDLSRLTSLASTQGLYIEDTGDSRLEDGDLTDLSGVNLTVDGTDTQVASAWTTFAGSITLNGGAQTLPNIATANVSGIAVNYGGTLTLSVATAQVTDTGSIGIGTGSTLDVAGNLTLTSSASLEEQIDGAPGSGLVGQVDVGGAAVLAGTFSVDVEYGFLPDDRPGIRGDDVRHLQWRFRRGGRVHRAWLALYRDSRDKQPGPDRRRAATDLHGRHSTARHLRHFIFLSISGHKRRRTGNHLYRDGAARLGATQTLQPAFSAVRPRRTGALISA